MQPTGLVVLIRRSRSRIGSPSRFVLGGQRERSRAPTSHDLSYEKIRIEAG